MHKVSVIIHTYNRAAFLERLFGALAQQSVGVSGFEVIVVDDGSIDDTYTVCDRAARQLPGLHYHRLDVNTGAAGASCVGIGQAQGDILLFTDDDCIPRPDWIEQMGAALEQYPIVAGAVESPRGDFIKLCHNIAQFQEFLPGRPAREVGFAPGANMGMRRSGIDATGLPDARCRYAYDTDLILRARERGFAVRFCPESVVLHDPPPERSRFTVVLKYAADHAAATILLRRRHRNLLRTPLVLGSPFLLALASPVIAVVATFRIFTRDCVVLQFWQTAPVVFLLKLAWCWGAARGLWRLRHGAGSC